MDLFFQDHGILSCEINPKNIENHSFNTMGGSQTGQDVHVYTTLTILGPQNDNILGILEQKDPNPRPGSKVFIILHGHAYFSFCKLTLVPIEAFTCYDQAGVLLYCL